MISIYIEHSLKKRFIGNVSFDKVKFVDSKDFYNKFFKHSANFGFAEFFIAKCIEIYKNDFDLEKIDNKFICSEVLKLKGIDSKL